MESILLLFDFCGEINLVISKKICNKTVLTYRGMHIEQNSLEQ